MILIITIVVAIAIALAGYAISTYNKLAKYKIRIEEAYATTDVYLKKRWDLIPNIVESVKGYAKHEDSVFKEIAELRQGIGKTSSRTEKMELESRVSDCLNTIVAIAEAFPELKADKGFSELREVLAQCENDIANSRKYYNAVIKEYNNVIVVFPSSLVAKLFGHEKMDMFTVREEERENVKVEF